MSTVNRILEVNEVHLYNARKAGIIAAWLGEKNPYVKGTKLYEAFNVGRKNAAMLSPRNPSDYDSYNPYCLARCVKRDWYPPLTKH